MDKSVILETINKLFLAVDQRDWGQLKSIMDDTVHLDYTSMTGGKPDNLQLSQIIEAWKGMLPGFDQTHHQLGNYLIEQDADSVKVFCYGTATHYLKNESGNNLWTVVGSYDFELKMRHEAWRITKMKFNLKYIDGNTSLPEIAQERLKSGV